MSTGETLMRKSSVTAAVVDRGGKFLLIEEHAERHCYPLIGCCVEDYLAGSHYRLSLPVRHFG